MEKRTGKIIEVLPPRSNEGKNYKRQDAILQTDDFKPTQLRFEFYDSNIDLMQQYFDSAERVEIEFSIRGYRTPKGDVFNNLLASTIKKA